MPNARLWSPDSPYLYDLDVWIVDAKSAASASDVTMVDHVRSYCGMRKISLGRDSQGTLRLMLNDEFIFQASTVGWQGTWTLPHTAQQSVKEEIQQHSCNAWHILRCLHDCPVIHALRWLMLFAKALTTRCMQMGMLDQGFWPGVHLSATLSVLVCVRHCRRLGCLVLC